MTTMSSLSAGATTSVVLVLLFMIAIGSSVTAAPPSPPQQPIPGKGMPIKPLASVIPGKNVNTAADAAIAAANGGGARATPRTEYDNFKQVKGRHCTSDAACAKDNSMYCTHFSRCVPKLPHGSPCTLNHQCLKGRCGRSEVCVGYLKLNDQCHDDSDCKPPLVCAQGVYEEFEEHDNSREHKPHHCKVERTKRIVIPEHIRIADEKDMGVLIQETIVGIMMMLGCLATVFYFKSRRSTTQDRTKHQA